MDRRAFVTLAAAVARLPAPCRAGPAARSARAVRVKREEPVIERTEFDPRRPPRDMPPLTPPESGVCKTTFELAASVSYSAERLIAYARRASMSTSSTS